MDVFTELLLRAVDDPDLSKVRAFLEDNNHPDFLKTYSWNWRTLEVFRQNLSRWHSQEPDWEELDVIIDSFIYVASHSNDSRLWNEYEEDTTDLVLSIYQLIGLQTEEVYGHFFTKVMEMVSYLSAHNPAVWARTLGQTITQLLNHSSGISFQDFQSILPHMISSSRYLDKLSREAAAQKHADLFNQFSQLITVCGVFGCQENIVEFLQLHMTASKITPAEFIDGDERTVQSFMKLSGQDFDVSVRLFLNEINERLKQDRKVWSIACGEVQLGGFDLIAPAMLSEIWIDLNQNSHQLVINCSDFQCPDGRSVSQLKINLDMIKMQRSQLGDGDDGRCYLVTALISELKETLKDATSEELVFTVPVAKNKVDTVLYFINLLSNSTVKKRRRMKKKHRRVQDSCITSNTSGKVQVDELTDVNTHSQALTSIPTEEISLNSVANHSDVVTENFERLSTPLPFEDATSGEQPEPGATSQLFDKSSTASPFMDSTHLNSCEFSEQLQPPVNFHTRDKAESHVNHKENDTHEQLDQIVHFDTSQELELLINRKNNEIGNHYPEAVVNVDTRSPSDQVVNYTREQEPLVYYEITSQGAEPLVNDENISPSSNHMSMSSSAKAGCETSVQPEPLVNYEITSQSAEPLVNDENVSPSSNHMSMSSSAKAGCETSVQPQPLENLKKTSQLFDRTSTSYLSINPSSQNKTQGLKDVLNNISKKYLGPQSEKRTTNEKKEKLAKLTKRKATQQNTEISAKKKLYTVSQDSDSFDITPTEVESVKPIKGRTSKRQIIAEGKVSQKSDVAMISSGCEKLVDAETSKEKARPSLLDPNGYSFVRWNSTKGAQRKSFWGEKLEELNVKEAEISKKTTRPSLLDPMGYSYLRWNNAKSATRTSFWGDKVKQLEANENPTSDEYDFDEPPPKILPSTSTKKKQKTVSPKTKKQQERRKIPLLKTQICEADCSEETHSNVASAKRTVTKKKNQNKTSPTTETEKGSEQRVAHNELPKRKASIRANEAITSMKDKTDLDGFISPSQNEKTAKSLKRASTESEIEVNQPAPQATHTPRSAMVCVEKENVEDYSNTYSSAAQTNGREKENVLCKEQKNEKSEVAKVDKEPKTKTKFFKETPKRNKRKTKPPKKLMHFKTFQPKVDNVQIKALAESKNFKNSVQSKSHVLPKVYKAKTTTLESKTEMKNIWARTALNEKTTEQIDYPLNQTESTLISLGKQVANFGEVRDDTDNETQHYLAKQLSNVGKILGDADEVAKENQQVISKQTFDLEELPLSGNELFDSDKENQPVAVIRETNQKTRNVKKNKKGKNRKNIKALKSPKKSYIKRKFVTKKKPRSVVRKEKHVALSHLTSQETIEFIKKLNREQVLTQSEYLKLTEDLLNNWLNEIKLLVRMQRHISGVVQQMTRCLAEDMCKSMTRSMDNIRNLMASGHDPKPTLSASIEEHFNILRNIVSNTYLQEYNQKINSFFTKNNCCLS